MRAHTFQFRLCLNPDCGLRYPLTDRSQFGERCPVCLSETMEVAQGRLDDEAAELPVSGSQCSVEAVIDNVRSAWNVGSIFRSAEGFGARHLYLCGITSTPENEQVNKSALGAQDMVPWSTHKNAVTLVDQLKAAGRPIWALERTRRSMPLEMALHAGGPPDNLVLVVGNEQVGIDPAVLERADHVVHIDMHGRKHSFNVAVAFAVAAALLMKR